MTAIPQSFSCLCVSGNCVAVASGGDDNAIAISLIRSSRRSASSFPTLERRLSFINSSAHSSQITGALCRRLQLKFHTDRFAIICLFFFLTNLRFEFCSRWRWMPSCVGIRRPESSFMEARSPRESVTTSTRVYCDVGRSWYFNTLCFQAVSLFLHRW